MNALYREELDELPQEAERERFRITDLSSLTWGMRKLAALKEKRAEVNGLADAEIGRIELYRQREMNAIQQSEDFLSGLIREYAHAKREEDPNFKRQVTPYGTIGFRKQQPEWNYGEDKTLVEWLENQGLSDFVKVEKTPKKADLKKNAVVKERIFSADGIFIEEHTFKWLDADRVIVDISSGEIITDETIKYHERAVVDLMTKRILPGVTVTERADSLDIKPEV